MTSLVHVPKPVIVAWLTVQTEEASEYKYSGFLLLLGSRLKRIITFHDGDEMYCIQNNQFTKITFIITLRGMYDAWCVHVACTPVEEASIESLTDRGRVEVSERNLQARLAFPEKSC